MQTFIVELYEINLNNGIIFISGSIEKRRDETFPFQSACIVSRVYGQAEPQLRDMLEGVLPDFISITVDKYGKIIDAVRFDELKRAK